MSIKENRFSLLFLWMGVGEYRSTDHQKLLVLSFLAPFYASIVRRCTVLCPSLHQHRKNREKQGTGQITLELTRFSTSIRGENGTKGGGLLWLWSNALLSHQCTYHTHQRSINTPMERVSNLLNEVSHLLNRACEILSRLKLHFLRKD